MSAKKSSLSVVIPSRDRPGRKGFVERAIASVLGQAAKEIFDISIVIGIDFDDSSLDISDLFGHDIRVVRSRGRSQATALNAAIRVLDSEFLAFLEDDDEWGRDFLRFAVDALKAGHFVSSTQLECDEFGRTLRINDFPTPSGWFMRLSTFHTVGLFDEAFKFHLDNEWLGRMASHHIPRAHLVESTAPDDVRFARQVRPWLANVVNLSKGTCRLVRHSSPYPLIRRVVHSFSGMSLISSSGDAKTISTREMAILKDRYGCLPW